MAKSYTEEMRTAGEGTREMAADLTNQALETAAKATDEIREASQGITSKIDSNRRMAAEKLENAASTLDQNADNLPGGETVAGFAHSAAGKMQATAEYLRHHSMQDMGRDVEKFIRKYPAQSLLAGVTAGFLVGLALKRSD